MRTFLEIARMTIEIFGWKSLVLLISSHLIVRGENTKGFIAYQNNKEIKINLMAVKLAHRNKGLGSEMLREVIEMKKVITIRAGNSKDFYEKFGFNKLKTVGGFLGKKSTILKRDN